jgi:hypothetical protein
MSISAMKQALDALDSDDPSIQLRAAVALRQAIAEAEKQEPVAWREVAGKTTHYYDYNEQGRGEPLYAAPVAQCYYPGCQTTSGCAGACSKTSPTAWAEITKEYVAVSDEPFENATPLYTKREWVGLTKMELIKLGVFPFGMSYELYEAIEAKLKEKNS